MMNNGMLSARVVGCTRLFMAALTCALVASACAVDEKSNPQRLDSEACKKLGGKPITDKFCFRPSDGPALDSGSDASMPSDAGSHTDAGSRTDSGMDASKPADAGSGADAAGADANSPACKEGASELCYSGADLSTSLQLPCHAGTRTCENGSWSMCKGDVTPEKETCDGVDNDCDGRSDEGEARIANDCMVEADSVKGECKLGMTICRQGKIECFQFVHPTSDTCNGRDDDCDGNTDENTATPCYDDTKTGCTKASGSSAYTCVGACAAGTKLCTQEGKYATSCTGLVTPQTETCTAVGQQRVDENCDGTVDEGCSCMDGSYACYTGSPPSSKNTLPCKAGTQTCSGGVLGSCTGEVTPKPESCANEGKDDDCNGLADDVAIRNTSCSDVSTAKGVCKATAVWQCSGGQAVCVDGPAAAAEVCDGQGADENCNGMVDEGFDLQTDGNNCGMCGNKCAAGTTCCGGTCVNTKSSNAHCGMCGKSCASGSTCCNSNCSNTKTDNANCGTCGNGCGGLTPNCRNGTCSLL